MGAFGVGGIATFEEFCPLDKLVVKFFEALKKLHEEYKGGKDDGEKMLFGKYTAKEAFTQIDSAVKMWCAKSGLEHKLEEEAPAAAPDGMEAMAMEEAMEGGEDAFGEIAGPGEIPKLLLAMIVCYPAFGDAVKAQV